MKAREVICPCCRYPTLHERGGDEICCLCNWEDDGQDDADADDVRGGPNGSYSLTAARLNFKAFLVMYRRDHDTRIMPGDSDVALVAKKELVAAFDAMTAATPDEYARLWATVARCRASLHQGLVERVREYERAHSAESDGDP